MAARCSLITTTLHNNKWSTNGYQWLDHCSGDLTGVSNQSPQSYKCWCFVTGPPNGPVLFCWLASVVCNAASGRAGWPPGMWTVGWLTLHGGPVWLRPVSATPCFFTRTISGHMTFTLSELQWPPVH